MLLDLVGLARDDEAALMPGSLDGAVRRWEFPFRVVG